MEIWISEAQERMVIFVAPEKLDTVLALFASEDVEATVIGKVTADKKIHLRYRGVQVGELQMDFLHDGMPKPCAGRNGRRQKLKSKVPATLLTWPRHCMPSWLRRTSAARVGDPPI
jgi:phosphoribosylformylglycinamidine synthase